MGSLREISMFTAQKGNVIPPTHPRMLRTSRTVAWRDGCQGSPKGSADITSFQLSKCPTACQRQSHGSEEAPSKCQRDGQDTGTRGFLLVQSQGLFSLRPESLRKERRERNHKEGTIFGDSLGARETSLNSLQCLHCLAVHRA